MVEDIEVRCTETASKEELEESGVLNQFLILDHNLVYLSPCQSSQAKTSSTRDEYPYFKNYWSVSLEVFSRSENCYVSLSLWFESLLDNACVNLLNWGAVSSFISPYHYWVPTIVLRQRPKSFLCKQSESFRLCGSCNLCRNWLLPTQCKNPWPIRKQTGVTVDQ